MIRNSKDKCEKHIRRFMAMASEKVQTEEDKNAWIPGLGENRPQPRPLKNTFFGYVPDAFSMKTPEMPSEKSSQKSSPQQVSAPEPDITSEVSLTEDIQVETIMLQEALPIDELKLDSRGRWFSKPYAICALVLVNVDVAHIHVARLQHIWCAYDDPTTHDPAGVNISGTKEGSRRV
ncbi:Protein of unknown function [Gryllus bimaculatus]|nr:Protein of unknown function [Gryllus bimaculatus]